MIRDTNLRLRIRRTLKRVVELLVQLDYAGLERISGGVRLRAADIEAGVVDYGRTLTYPPTSAYEDIDVVRIDGTVPPEYSIRFRLFTEEESRPDLELQATFVDDNPAEDVMRVELENILVP